MPDLKNPQVQQAAMEAFFFGYQAFTAKPDEMLARRGLSRVHHRILFFIAKYPGLSMKELLGYLGVSKQALNGPLRTLVENGLISAEQDQSDRRIKRLSLSSSGMTLEQALSDSQRNLLGGIFDEAGKPAEQQWRTIMHRIASSQFSHLLPEMLPAEKEDKK